jgi:hypothetical protein
LAFRHERNWSLGVTSILELVEVDEKLQLHETFAEVCEQRRMRICRAEIRFFGCTLRAAVGARDLGLRNLACRELVDLNWRTIEWDQDISVDVLVALFVLECHTRGNVSLAWRRCDIAGTGRILRSTELLDSG